MSRIFQDVRFALRQLRRSPGFTVAAVLCLALGIGANSTAFSFASSVLWREAPLPGADRLVRLYAHWDNGLRFGSFSYPDFVDLQERSSETLEVLAAEALTPVHMSIGGETESMYAALVTDNYFSGLGVPIQQGRGFLAAEGEVRGGAPVAVVSNHAWTGRFGSDPNMIGREVRFNGYPFEVVGIAGAEWVGSSVGINPDFYLPMMMEEQVKPGSSSFDSRGNHWISTIIGRLRPGVTVEQAQTTLGATMTELTEEFPQTNSGKTVEVFAERDAAVYPGIRDGFVKASLLVFVVVGFILLLACANVAGLLLARASSRRREIGVRMALGAGRRRVVSQLLVESAVLAVGGALMGLVFMRLLSAVLSASIPSISLPMYMEYEPQPVVFVFTAAVSIVAALVFGLAPALQATRLDIVSDLKAGAPGQSGERSSRSRRFLVATQMGLSVLLLVSAGFVLRGMQAQSRLDPGFEPDHLVVGGVDLELQGYSTERAQSFHEELLRRLASYPSVEGVGTAAILPLAFSSSQSSAIPEGHEDVPIEKRPSVDRNTVDHGYFEAAGIDLLGGRGFLESDHADSPPVMVVNQAFVERYWPGESGVGKRVQNGTRDFEVIGVVETGKYLFLSEDPKPYMYFHLPQRFQGNFFLFIRTVGDAEAVLPMVRSEVHALDPDLPISGLQSMHSHMSFSTAPMKMLAGVVMGFAGLALLLAAVGLYGVLAFWVSQGTREIAVRMAMGAGPSEILRGILRQGLVMAGIGAAAGGIASLGVGVLVSKLIQGVNAFDPVPVGVALGLLGLVSIAAALIPAWRATRLNPVSALRG